MSDINNQLRRYIGDNFVMGTDAADFSDTDSLLDLHIVDSTGILELIMFLEETYGFQVADAEMIPENLDNLEAIEAYVMRKQQARKAVV